MKYGSYHRQAHPNRDDVLRTQRTLEGWGPSVNLGDNAFRQYGYLAGTHEERDETSDAKPHLRGDTLRAALMTTGPRTITSRQDEPTSQLTTSGTVGGPLLGGNLDMVAAGAGSALPDLNGAMDRQLTMLRKAGHLDGIKGVAVGQFTKFKPSKGVTIVSLLQDHLARLGVPILGGLPLGHGDLPATVP